MEKNAFGLANILGAMGRGTVKGMKHVGDKVVESTRTLGNRVVDGTKNLGNRVAERTKNLGNRIKNETREFLSLKPSERVVIDKFTDKNGITHDIYGSKPRFNLLDIVFPYAQSFINPIRRDGWKESFRNYGMYMRKNPVRGVVKTLKNIAFPSSLPLTLTILKALDGATSTLNSDGKYSASNKGAQTGLGARLAGGALAAGIQSSLPKWLAQYILPESATRAAQMWRTTAKYAPGVIDEARRYNTNLLWNAIKGGAKEFAKSYNPLNNYSIYSAVNKSGDFLSEAKDRINTVTDYGAGIISGHPYSADLSDDFIDGTTIDDRLKAERAGIINGVADDYVFKGKDIVDSIEDQLASGISRSAFRDSIRKGSDTEVLHKSFNTIKDDNSSYLDKAKSVYDIYNRTLPGSYVK